MKILFLGRHYTYFRNFESVLRDLATRGHRLHLAVEQEDVLGGSKLVTRGSAIPLSTRAARTASMYRRTTPLSTVPSPTNVQPSRSYKAMGSPTSCWR